MQHSLIWTGFLASLGTGAMTGVRALPLYLPFRISARAQDVMLGFAAGVMLARLGVLADRAGPGSRGRGLRRRVAGGAHGRLRHLVLGAVALWWVNACVPHEHFILGREGTASTSLRRIWVFVIAITLHNFPEGLAVGVGYGAGNLGAANALAIGIGLQNLPEGLAVAMALWGEDYSRAQAFTLALLTGMVEPIGGLIGVSAVTLVEPLLPWSLAFAAGAMVFVISSENHPRDPPPGLQDRRHLRPDDRLRGDDGARHHAWVMRLAVGCAPKPARG